MPKGVENPTITLEESKDGVRIVFSDGGESLHVNSDRRVYVDEPGKKKDGKYLTTLKS